MFIREIKSHEILDSRGNPTLETQIMLSDGTIGTASVPSGASTGGLEAMELRDKDYARYLGMGVLRAVENVNNVIAGHLYKKDPTDQIEIDKLLNAIDGTGNKGHLGANAILSVSLGVARAVAQSKKIPLYEHINQVYQQVNRAMFKNDISEGVEPPQTTGMKIPIPVFNLINGGKHANDDLTFQEFLLIPHGVAGYADQLRAGVEIWHHLKNLLEKYNYNTGLGDEGGLAPNLDSNEFAPNVSADERALEFLLEAVKQCGHTVKEHISLGLDIAADTFYTDKQLYSIPEEKRHLNTTEMVKYLGELTQKYPLLMLEDGLAEGDISGWRDLTQKLGKQVILVGDDLFATNIIRLKIGVDEKLANSIVIKPNQIGTLVETLETVIYAQQNKYSIVVAHRSGETNDSFIADLAVAVGAEFLKAGAPVRGERVAKYNRLLEIVTTLGQTGKTL